MDGRCEEEVLGMHSTNITQSKNHQCTHRCHCVLCTAEDGAVRIVTIIMAAKVGDGANTVNDALTADEAEQYDRQIRLWGLDAQKR